MQTQAHPSEITPDYVLSLTCPTKDYLCQLSDNIYGIEFVYFRIRNYQTNDTLVQITKKAEQIGKPPTHTSRKIRYNFTPYFFLLRIIGTTLRFHNPTHPLKDFKMIQRHYFKNTLIKSYEFTAPFCMPNSTNQMEAIYQLPDLSQQIIADMIAHPWQTVSDSFYFVAGRLVMHTKAEFSYAARDDDQEDDGEM